MLKWLIELATQNQNGAVFPKTVAPSCLWPAIPLWLECCLHWEAVQRDQGVCIQASASGNVVKRQVISILASYIMYRLQDIRISLCLICVHLYVLLSRLINLCCWKCTHHANWIVAWIIWTWPIFCWLCSYWDNLELSNALHLPNRTFLRAIHGKAALWHSAFLAGCHDMDSQKKLAACLIF